MKIIIYLALTFSLFACKKEVQVLECTSNCKTFTLRGRVYNGVANVGLHTALRLRWERFRNNCLYCPGDQYDIYVGKTDASGNFNFSFTVDTSRFLEYSLKLITPSKSDFYNSFTGYIDQPRLNQVPIDVVYYPTTTLTLKLFRVQTDSIKFVNIFHEWKQVHGNGQLTYIADYFAGRPILSGDTTITMVTAADIPTIVTVEKRFPDNSFLDIKDTIICSRTQNNLLTMYY